MRTTRAVAGMCTHLQSEGMCARMAGFVQRGELILERMRTMCEQGNLKGVKREALKMKAAASKLESWRLASLSKQLIEHAEAGDAALVDNDVVLLQQRLNQVMNYSVRSMLVANTLAELAEDLRLAGKSEEPQMALMQMTKAAAEFAQLSDYLSIRAVNGSGSCSGSGGGSGTGCDRSDVSCGSVGGVIDSGGITPHTSHGQGGSAAETGEQGETEELQCKATVAACVHNGKGMLAAMQREQARGTLDHAAACALVADTLLEVMGDLSKAAESDEMEVVSRCAERVNSRFFQITDLARNNSMVAEQQQQGGCGVPQNSAQAERREKKNEREREKRARRRTSHELTQSCLPCATRHALTLPCTRGRRR